MTDARPRTCTYATSCLLVAGTLLAAGAPSAAAAPAPVAWQRIVVDPAPGPLPVEKALADIDKDGRLDIVIGFGKRGICWYQFPASGKPTDRWIRHTIVPDGRAYEAMAPYDVNRDGRIDLVASFASAIQWFENRGTSWILHRINTGSAHEIRLTDIDGDGKADVVTGPKRHIAFQNSPTSWTVRTWGEGAAGVPRVGLGMLDIGSGKGAINIVGVSSGGVYWFENPRERGGNARTGAWIAHRIGNDDGGPPSLAIFDVDGDGRADIVQAPGEFDSGPRGLFWWQAPVDRRNGTWTVHEIDRTVQLAHQLSTGDFNRDGHTDILLTEQQGAKQKRIEVLYGDGRGGFTTQVLARTGGHNQTAGDVDGDGDLDFINANHAYFGGPNPLELFINRLR